MTHRAAIRCLPPLPRRRSLRAATQPARRNAACAPQRSLRAATRVPRKPRRLHWPARPIAACNSNLKYENPGWHFALIASFKCHIPQVPAAAVAAAAQTPVRNIFADPIASVNLCTTRSAGIIIWDGPGEIPESFPFARPGFP
jgi:hypothetical protein